MADYHIREAAETLLSNVTVPPYRNLSHTQSVNLVSEDLVAGHRPQGKMSAIRRFFCLFATFDLLFTSLMWLICVVMRGETLVQIMDREVVHYDIKVSLFDIVMLAIIRFGVLMMFYGIFYINNWSVIALSTSCTCAFLIAKVFVYDWPNAAQPVYQVFLILSSFTLSWGEAWFLDFRVLPQELQAKQIIEAIVATRDVRVDSCRVQHGASERTPLLTNQRHLRPPSTHGESTVNWFSPVQTPESSPRPRRAGDQVILTQEQMESKPNNTPAIEDAEHDKHLMELENVGTEEELEKKLNSMSVFGFSLANFMKTIFNRDRSTEPFKAEWLSIDEYKQMAEECMQESFSTLHLTNWKLEKRGCQKGDLVESTHTEKYGKIYRLTALVDCPAKFLYDEFKDNLTKLPEWNPTILKSEIIKVIGPGVDLSYQVTAGGGKGIIAPRDFVILRRTAALSSDGKEVDQEPYAYISSGVSVQVPGYPPFKDLVRGHNKVGCWFIRPKVLEVGGKTEQRSVFQWLMCCDLKGKIPQFVLDAAFATVMLDYLVHVRKFAADSKSKGLF